jgi:Dolichyl-phosphate-mannose-protein mannosyltransferase
MTSIQLSNTAMTQSNVGSVLDQEKTHVVQSIESKFLWILTLILALAGILLRIEKAVLGRSFRGDEAALASAIQNHSLVELIIVPLGGSVTAPLGFLAIEKLVVGLLGFQDFFYRLIPLIAGCLSVVLMYFVAKEVLDNFGAAFAVGAFSLNWMLSFYSSDLKQYSTDVAFALLIYLMAARYFKNNSTKNIVWLTVAGLIGLFCSHPAIFLLSATGLALVFQTWRYGGGYKKIFLIGSLWVGVFLILYFLSYRYVGESTYNVSYWSNLGALMPVPPWKNPGWFVQRLSNFFVVDLNLSQFAFIEAALYGFGIIFFLLKKKWPWSFIFLGSMIFTFLASGIANYPFKGRLILFLAPSTLLAIGAGIDGFALILKTSTLLSHGIRWLLTVYLLMGPIISTIGYLQEPRAYPFQEDIKPAMSYVEQHIEANDQFVIYDQAVVTYKYYAPFYDLNNFHAIYLGDYRKKPINYNLVVDALPKNQRIWFIFSNVYKTRNEISDRTYIFDYLESIGGQIIEQYGGTDTFSSAYLVIIK